MPFAASTRPRPNDPLLCPFWPCWPCPPWSVGAPEDLTDEEQQHLSQVLSQGSSSAVDLIHALETHLAKYPDSPKKNDIERAILKAAIQANDDPRIARYGERVLRRSPDDVTVLDPVCRALVLDGNAERVNPAWNGRSTTKSLVRAAMKEMPARHAGSRAAQDEADRMLSHALLYPGDRDRRAWRHQNRRGLARKSFEIYPVGRSRLELARRSALLGKTDEASAPTPMHSPLPIRKPPTPTGGNPAPAG